MANPNVSTVTGQQICNILPPELSPSRLIEFATGTVSIILNSTIIYFNLFNTPRDLKDYRIFLLKKGCLENPVRFAFFNKKNGSITSHRHGNITYPIHRKRVEKTRMCRRTRMLDGSWHSPILRNFL
jgi:hypothetical protein